MGVSAFEKKCRPINNVVLSVGTLPADWGKLYNRRGRMISPTVVELSIVEMVQRRDRVILLMIKIIRSYIDAAIHQRTIAAMIRCIVLSCWIAEKTKHFKVSIPSRGQIWSPTQLLSDSKYFDVVKFQSSIIFYDSFQMTSGKTVLPSIRRR